jgi:iron only hydrogenase large subunit-like protein
MHLAPLIEIDEKKCLNCHQCIAACPVKFANNGSEDVIHINHDLCIGCSQCIHTCTHDARKIMDDFDKAMYALTEQKIPSVAIVAPAIASSFPGKFLNFNGWLKSLGIEAIFDVSFGAELTVKTYLEHVKTKPKAVIAQPCPAIVSYIQIYKPALIPYLAPAHSPMVHTMKMIRHFYPQYNNHKIIVISPCIAKRREFDETGMGDYNVTISNIIRYMEANNIILDEFEQVDFDNEPAERAVLFSTPGGLLETAERESPGIRSKTRKIEGVHTIYKYLDQLDESIAKGINPALIDCLNCEAGCNGGSGTPFHDSTPDELEHHISSRKDQTLQYYNINKDEIPDKKNLQNVINKYWKAGIYERTYDDLSENFKNLVKEPDENELNQILLSMAKHSDEDIKNCASCGYNDCREMARAIYNNYNKKENCHFYLSSNLHNNTEKLKSRTQELLSNSEELLHAMEKIKQLIED